MKNKNLTITIILSSLIIILFLLSLFYTIDYKKVYYDKLIEENGKYSFGNIILQNNFFIPQTISVKEDYYCIEYIEEDSYTKNNYTLYTKAQTNYEGNSKILEEKNYYPYYYNEYNTIYVNLKPKQKTTIKILLDLKSTEKNIKNYNSQIKIKLEKFYIVKTEEKYFNCNELKIQNNNYEIVKEYNLN